MEHDGSDHSAVSDEFDDTLLLPSFKHDGKRHPDAALRRFCKSKACSKARITYFKRIWLVQMHLTKSYSPG